MNVEDLLLVAALGCLAWLVVDRARWLHDPTRRAAPVSRLLGAASLTLGAATLLMLAYFLLTRLDIEYVFTYTSTDTPAHYRVAGLWGGQKGTLLLWATFSSVFLWINSRAWRGRREQAPDPAALDRVLAWIELVGAAITAGFVLLLILGGLFDRTDPFLLNAKPNGTGLQPVLLTPFMLIHPPIQFVAYAISTILFGAGIAAVLTRDRVWADVALPWTRFGFVVALTGLGLGGLWAYYVLNFGGYWAWDPVETANLIAFFPLLLLVHSVIYYRKRGMYATIAPVFAALTLLVDLFATVATRTGLWVSVHAFTDPSRNFAADPLTRLLNILDTGILLQGLTAMLCVAVLLVLAAYANRLRVDAPATGKRSWARSGATAGLVLLFAFGAVAIADVRFFLSLLFEGADLIGFDNANLGLGILLFGAAVLVAAPTLSHTPPTDEKRRPLLDYVDTARLVFLGVILLSLAFLVVFLLQILSVNGYDRGVYDDRAPIVAMPILVVLGAGLSHAFFGKRLTVALSIGAALAGMLLALVFRDAWELMFVVPAFAFALAGTSLKLYKVSDPGAAGDPRLRAAGALLLAGGILSMVYWSNPPSRVPLGFTTLYPSAWWAALGFPLGLLGALSSIGTLRTATKRAHRVGACALVLSWGFGVSALLGILAFALAESRRRAFPDADTPKPLVVCIAGVRREVRKTGVYLMHVAIVLGLLGYALSTYAAGEETAGMLREGQPSTIHGYEFTLVGSSNGGLDPDQGALREVSGLVEVRRDGRLLTVAPLTMWLELYHHYAERVAVERFAAEDVYVRPVAFLTPERPDGFVAHEDNVVLVSGDVSAVAVTVKTLPGMHLVWGGLWIIVAGMLVNLVALGSPWEFSRPKPGASAE